jgi:hypothetical protein
LLFDWTGLIVQKIAMEKEFHQELRDNGPWFSDNTFVSLTVFENPKLLDAIAKRKEKLRGELPSAAKAIGKYLRTA